MTGYEKIYELCKSNNGIVTAAEVSENSIPSWYLSDLVKKGQLIKIDRGIYATEQGDYDEYYFFQIRNKRCIYSYASALYMHRLTERVPYKKEVTVYKGYNSSHITNEAIVHYVKKDIYLMGVTECKTVFGNTVNVYDKERTICDLIVSRKEIDVEIFSKAIKSYAKDIDRDYKKLRRYAKEMKIQSKLDDILEIV